MLSEKHFSAPPFFFSHVEQTKEGLGVLNLWEMIQQQVLNEENHKYYSLTLKYSWTAVTRSFKNVSAKLFWSLTPETFLSTPMPYASQVGVLLLLPKVGREELIFKNWDL